MATTGVPSLLTKMSGAETAILLPEIPAWPTTVQLPLMVVVVVEVVVVVVLVLLMVEVVLVVETVELVLVVVVLLVVVVASSTVPQPRGLNNQIAIKLISISQGFCCMQ
ncbi:hypothetical protein A2311_01415 [candidate division WOR-1 bacterium RIFOXYB2_FULL_48_7]|uniref:Uncharacterized protein n=1 Tax=candidate division WOR-1 bacterium RIFOXYB2_FULL_48_7 TaxID=1802583 RepID=A0A1F4TUA4_UNCSA|nr:MAG: hypothetical protein A2311_01415 [candidate division WOR-1 bacterium RIFOXYB2_FULL_48_7]